MVNTGLTLILAAGELVMGYYKNQSDLLGYYKNQSDLLGPTDNAFLILKLLL